MWAPVRARRRASCERRIRQTRSGRFTLGRARPERPRARECPSAGSPSSRRAGGFPDRTPPWSARKGSPRERTRRTARRSSSSDRVPGRAKDVASARCSVDPSAAGRQHAARATALGTNLEDRLGAPRRQGHDVGGSARGAAVGERSDPAGTEAEEAAADGALVWFPTPRHGPGGAFHPCAPPTRRRGARRSLRVRAPREAPAPAPRARPRRVAPPVRPTTACSGNAPSAAS